MTQKTPIGFYAGRSFLICLSCKIRFLKGIQFIRQAPDRLDESGQLLSAYGDHTWHLIVPVLRSHRLKNRWPDSNPD